MKVDRIIEEALRKANLKKIRIKVDPRQLVNQGFEHCTSFEGHVIEECGNSLKVYLINPPPEVEPVQMVDRENARELNNTFFSKEVILSSLAFSLS